MGFYKLEKHQLNDRASQEVNVSNGNLIIVEHDLQVQGTGLDLIVDRIYNNLSSSSGDLGAGWLMGTGRDVGLTFSGSNVIFNGPSGYSGTFTSNGSGYTSPPGIDATLTKNGDGSYRLTFNHSQEKYNFTSGGFLTSDVDRNNNTISFFYDANDALSSIKDTQGRVTEFGYTVIGTCDVPGSGLITSMTDSSGRVFKYGYANDGTCDLTTYTDPSNKTTTYGYTGGDLTEIKDPNGDVTKLTYDSSYRIKTVGYVYDLGGDAYTTSYTYGTGARSCPSGQAYAGNTISTDPNNHATTYCYNSNGLVTAVVDAEGHNRQTSYDSDYNVSRVTDAAGQPFSFTWSTDHRNNLIKAQGPTGAAMSFTYANASQPYQPDTSTDSQGNVLKYAYDSSGNLHQVTNQQPTQNQETINHNSNGTVSSIVDADNNTTSFSYDAEGNMLKITYPSPRSVDEFSYDALSRVETHTDGNSQKTSFTYDALDRVLKVSYQDGSSISYTPDADGNLLQMKDAAESVAYTYDALNRVTKQVLSVSGTSTFAYDGVGNLTELVNPGGTVSYHYNAVNLVDTITEPSGAKTTFDYDADGNRLHTNYPNGVVMTQSYDNSGRLTSIVATKASTTLTSYSYCYNVGCSGADTGLRQQVTDNVRQQTTTYSYDHLNRLTAANGTKGTGSYAYGYDGNGNLLSKTANGARTSYAYNAANELCWSFGGVSSAACGSPPVGATTYEYDAAGNLKSNSAGLSISYDARNHTTSVTPPGGSALNMSYMGATQADRITAGDDVFAYDQLGLAYERTNHATYGRDNSGVLTEERLNSGGGAEGTPYYYLYNGLGSVVGLTDSNGNLVNSYQYSPLGKITQQTGSVANPWTFASGFTDRSTGQVHFGARYYEPNLGAWAQPDVASTKVNRYLYAGDDPINLVDPSGMFCWIDVGIGAIAFAAGIVGVLTFPFIPVTVPALLAYGAGFVTLGAGGYGLARAFWTPPTC